MITIWDLSLRIFLSSLILGIYFYSMPLIINFANNKILITDEFRNNSKEILAYVGKK